MYNNRSLKLEERAIGILLIVCLTILQGINVSGSFGITSFIYIIAFIYYVGDNRFQKIAFSWPLMIWLVLTIYHYINAKYIHHVPKTDIIDLMHGLRVYSCLVIFAYYACIDFKGTVKLLLDAYTTKAFLALLFLLSGGYSAEDRLTGAGASATGLGQSAAICCIFLVYYNCYKRLSILKNVQYLAIPLIIIVLSQTRNAFAMASISIMITQVVRISKISRSVILTSILSAFSIIIALGMVFYFLQDSGLASRFAKGEEYVESHFYRHNATGTFFDVIVGDRLPYYINGWEFFLKSPVTGIGMWNYKYLTGGIYPLHSEYMVHLCEGGVIGASLWLSFILFNIFIIWKCININKYKWSAISSIIVILFCAIYAREFFGEVFCPPYSLILAWYCSKKFYHKNYNKILNVDPSISFQEILEKPNIIDLIKRNK